MAALALLKDVAVIGRSSGLGSIDYLVTACSRW